MNTRGGSQILMRFVVMQHCIFIRILMKNNAIIIVVSVPYYSICYRGSTESAQTSFVLMGIFRILRKNI